MDRRGEQPLCHGALCPRTRAALGDPQPSLGALRAASLAQTLKLSVANPKGVTTAPGLSPWSPQTISCVAGCSQHAHT